MRHKISSKIYLTAAQQCFYHKDFACVAIVKASDDFVPMRRFSEYFQPEKSDGVWFGDLTKKNQLTRQLALLFMAEIAKDSDS